MLLAFLLLAHRILGLFHLIVPRPHLVLLRLLTLLLLLLLFSCLFLQVALYLVEFVD
jgi:hypothetical protein